MARAVCTAHARASTTPVDAIASDRSLAASPVDDRAFARNADEAVYVVEEWRPDDDSR